MSQPFIGEIRMFGGSFAPAGWVFCNGQLMPISQNDALFTLIGTTYGGDGQSTFGIPDLQGRVPIHQGTVSGTTFTIGEKAGTESVTLTTQQIPIHNHAFLASTQSGTAPQPQGAYISRIPSGFLYTGFSPGVQMNNTSVQPVGGSQPHDNMLPFLVVSFILSLFGVFPTQN
jgi:microcystin-dependent protein